MLVFCARVAIMSIVVYYDLVRFLLSECWDRRAEQTRTQPPPADALTAEVRRLTAEPWDEDLPF